MKEPKGGHQEVSDLIKSRNLDEVTPYALLVVNNVPESSITSSADFFHLHIAPGSYQNEYYLMTLERLNGVHKLQTVTLFAAALWIHFNFPKAAQLALGTRCDFMREEASHHQDWHLKNSELSQGCLAIEPPCQLFLQQAGFHLDPQNRRIVFKSEELDLHREYFLNQSGLHVAWGA